MWNNVRYILLTAQRDSIFFGLAGAIVFGCYISFFLGSTALAESAQMSLVYAAGVSRLIVVLGLIIFVAFHIRRSFENKEIDQMIVRPISREKFIISYWLGFAIVALFFVIFTSLILYIPRALEIFTSTFDRSSMEKAPDNLPDLFGLTYWGISLLAESLIIVSLVMAASLILRSTVVAILLCIGFYVLSRMAGFLLLIVTKPGPDNLANDTFMQISKLIPRVDFFSKTEWLIYGLNSWNEVHLFLMQAAVYIGLLLALAIIDFKRKQF